MQDLHKASTITKGYGARVIQQNFALEPTRNSVYDVPIVPTNLFVAALDESRDNYNMFINFPNKLDFLRSTIAPSGTARVKNVSALVFEPLKPLNPRYGHLRVKENYKS